MRDRRAMRACVMRGDIGGAWGARAERGGTDRIDDDGLSIIFGSLRTLMDACVNPCVTFFVRARGEGKNMSSSSSSFVCGGIARGYRYRWRRDARGDDDVE